MRLPRWFEELPWWVRAVPLLVGAALLCVCAEAAVLGRYGSGGGLTGGLLGAAVAVFGQLDFWRLDAPSRATVRRAYRTGQASGDRRLDLLALTRLEQAAQIGRAGRVAAVVATAFFVVVPFVAAWRATPWWLLVELLSGAVAWRTVTILRLGDPRPRRARLERQLSP